MKCDACREMIDLAFGLDILTAEFKTHLDSCPKCRDYYQESLALASDLADDTRFHPTADELKQIARGIKASMSETTNITAMTPERKKLPGQRWYLAAAVILLSLGVYWSTQQPSNDYVVEQFVSNIDSSLETLALTFDGLVSEVLIADQSYQPDQNAYEMLLDEYTFGRSLVAGDEVLSELSEEELIYLEENFDIEELVL